MKKSTNLREILEHLRSGVNFAIRNDADGKGDFVTDNLGQLPTDVEIDRAVPVVAAAVRISDLVRYAEENAIRHGSTMLDPVTDLPIGDPNTETIVGLSKKQGQSRMRLVKMKRTGQVGMVAKANAAQKVEEDLAEEIYNVITDITSGLVKTEAEIDTRVTAVNLVY